MSGFLHHAVVFRKYGGPEVLQVEEQEQRSLADREVRLDVLAFALNRADLMFIHGEHYTIPVFPSRIGSEAVGIVTEVADGVHEFAVGDRVTAIPFFTTTDGVQGASAVVPADFLTPAPIGLDDAEACSVWMQYLTPYFAFEEVARLRKGDTVLITAAASSAGLGALQMACVLGLRTVATTRSPDKVELLLRSGATAAVVMGSDDLGAEIDRVSGGRGLAAAFDPVGGTSLDGYVDHLARGATVFGYGTLSDRLPEIPVAAMCRAQAVFHPYSMFNHVVDPEQRARGCKVILDAIQAGELRPTIDRVFGFDQVVDAYHYMESNQQAGKIVVRVR
jgi:NADPH:quinone reductase-like Zn-dependent oxidoreductase